MVVAQVSELQPIRRTIDIMQASRSIVPLLAIAVALLIVVIAHRRERALGIVGAAVALAGLVSLAVIWLRRHVRHPDPGRQGSADHHVRGV